MIAAEPGPPRTSTPTRRVGAVLAAGLLLFQLANFAASGFDALHVRWELRTLSAPGQPVGTALLPLTVYRGLGELAPLIPPDAPVLLVADSDTPLAYDFQLLPRPLHVLLTVDDALAARVARIDPVVGARVVDWQALVDSRDQRLTPESLRRWLGRSDWLVTVQSTPAPLVLAKFGPTRQLVAQQGPVTLYFLARP